MIDLLFCIGAEPIGLRRRAAKPLPNVEKVRLPPSSPFTASGRRKIFYQRRPRLRSSGERGAIIEKASTLAPPVARGSHRSDFFNTIGGNRTFATAAAASPPASNLAQSLRELAGAAWPWAATGPLGSGSFRDAAGPVRANPSAFSRPRPSQRRPRAAAWRRRRFRPLR